MPTPIIERRIFPRLDFVTENRPEVSVSCPTKQVSFFGEMRDISASGFGMTFQSSQAPKISVGESLQFTLSPLGQESIDCHGLVVRSVCDKNSVHLGIEFKDLPLIYQERLREKIEIELFERQEKRIRPDIPKTEIVKAHAKKAAWVAFLLGGPILIGLALSSDRAPVLEAFIRTVKILIGE